jgi:hypothetical protein
MFQPSMALDPSYRGMLSRVKAKAATDELARRTNVLYSVIGQSFLDAHRDEIANMV